MTEEEDIREWYELSPEELADNEEAQEAKQKAYAASFFRTDEGRAVLFDLYKFMNERYPDGQEFAVANVAFNELYMYIKASSGIKSEKDIIDACVDVI